MTTVKKRSATLSATLKASKHKTSKTNKTASKKSKVKSAASINRTLTGRRIALNRLIAIYGAIIILTAIVAVVVATSTGKTDHALADPFSSNQRMAAGFNLYYPTKLPINWQVDPASLTNLQQSIVTYRLLDPSGASATITEQKTPEGFSYPTLYRTFGNRQDIKTPLGPMTTGIIDDGKTQLSSLVTSDGTWILLSSNQQINQKDLKLIFSNFKASKD